MSCQWPPVTISSSANANAAATCAASINLGCCSATASSVRHRATQRQQSGKERNVSEERMNHCISCKAPIPDEIDWCIACQLWAQEQLADPNPPSVEEKGP